MYKICIYIYRYIFLQQVNIFSYKKKINTKEE